VVVLSYPALELVEVATASAGLAFPYIPGLLSFREAPLVLAAWETLSNKPDLLFVDGQGVAHPRRLGIASHLGLVLDMPVIGCAKSRLCGEAATPGLAAGSRVPLFDGGEVIGMVVRSKDGAKPLYISVGYKISLESALAWTERCLRGHRLPEPARLAHLAAGGNLPGYPRPPA
jgi:deoxyribonuclease V